MISGKDIENEIEALEDQLRCITSEYEKLKKHVPDGTRLRAAKHRNSYQYFIKSPESNRNGEYVKKKDLKTASALTQLEYDLKLIEELHKRIEELKRFQAAIVDPFDNALGRMVLGKRELVKPHYLSDEVYISRWLNQEYSGLSFEDKSAEYYTKSGLRVRSKSEILIADILDDLAIPFLYEKPLHLNSEIVHPDFTLLNIKQRKEMYWEHFGMMDDMDYRNKAFLKIRKYEANGLFRHDSFIWTFETGRFPLDTKAIRKMAQEIKNTLGYQA